MVDEREAYDVLQVQPTADPDVVRAAYRALARRYHPDGTAPDRDRMTQLNAAYERVGTPEARARYDAAREAPVATGPGRDDVVPTPAWPAGPLSRRRARVAGDDRAAVIDFGRYAGWRISDLARLDADYLRWLSRHSAGIRFRDAIEQALPGEVELGRRGSPVG